MPYTITCTNPDCPEEGISHRGIGDTVPEGGVHCGTCGRDALVAEQLLDVDPEAEAGA